MLSQKCNDAGCIIFCMDIQTDPARNDPYEQQYPDDEQQHLQVIVEQHEPLEQVVSLAHRSVEHPEQKQQLEHKTKLVAKLRAILDQKLDEVRQAKKSVADCKTQIKDINEQVDREMNKSIIRHSKPHNNVDIKSIFQSPKHTDPQVVQLTNELNKIRSECKKIKAEVKVVESQVIGPIGMLNSEKASEAKTRIRELEVELRAVKQEKQFLESELKMMSLDDAPDEEATSQEIKNNTQKNAEYLSMIKQDRNKLYEIEKQDRLLTEKIRFLEELELHVETKKSRASSSSILAKEEIDGNVRAVMEEIRQIIERRNKAETQRRNLFRNLQNQVSGLENKNWEMINKLRQIDALLLRHYNSKVKKPKAIKESPQQGAIMTEKPKPSEITVKTAKTLYVVPKNDKNVTPMEQSEPSQVLVEKKKAYEFYLNSQGNQEPATHINLSDEMLGNKLLVKSISFVIDENTLYGFSAEYANEHKSQIKGYKIMSRIKPKDVISKVLVLDTKREEVINFVHVGVDNKQHIRYLHLVTSEAKEFRWGDLEKCTRNEQKNIRKYESIVMKGRLVQLPEKDAPNYYCLGGIGFNVIYLSPK